MKKVIVSIATREMELPRELRAMGSRLMDWEKRIAAVQFTTGQSCVGWARNVQLTRAMGAAKHHDASHILVIDDDLWVPTDLVTEMIDTSHPRMNVAVNYDTRKMIGESTAVKVNLQGSETVFPGLGCTLLSVKALEVVAKRSHEVEVQVTEHFSERITMYTWSGPLQVAAPPGVQGLTLWLSEDRRLFVRMQPTQTILLDGPEMAHVLRDGTHMTMGKVEQPKLDAYFGPALALGLSETLG